MTTDTIDFLTTLLFTARGGGDDIQDVMLEGKHADDFSQAFTEATEKFIDGFRAHIESTGFNMSKLDTAERSFGGNVYFSLSGHGCGFFDDRDEGVASLHERLKEWAGGSRFEGLDGMLDVGDDGKIDLSFVPEALEEYRGKYFGVPVQGHTPGPWDTGSRMTKVQIQPPEWNMPMFIADCDCQHGPKTEAEKVANARLIAMAPELLRFLEGVMTFWAQSKDEEMPAALFDGALAAIAKAKGGAPC